MLFGGRGSPTQPLNDVWIFDPLASSWQLQVCMFKRFMCVSLPQCNTYIFQFYLFYICIFQNHTILYYAQITHSGPTPRWRHASCAITQSLVVVGGRDDKGFADMAIHTFDTSKIVLMMSADVSKLLLPISDRNHIDFIDAWIWKRVDAVGETPIPRHSHTLTQWQDGFVMVCTYVCLLVCCQSIFSMADTVPIIMCSTMFTFTNNWKIKSCKCGFVLEVPFTLLLHSLIPILAHSLTRVSL